MNRGTQSFQVPLNPGVTALLADERSRAPHRAAVATQLHESGQVLWVDARDTASSYALYDLAPSSDVLAGITIARAWTAHQHYTLVSQLVTEVSPRTRLLVLPNVCSLYRDDDLTETMADRLLESTLGTIAELAASASLPIVISTRPDERAAIEPFVDTVREPASFASHARGPHDDWIQTTIPEWARRRGTTTMFGPSSLSPSRQTVLAPPTGQERCW